MNYFYCHTHVNQIKPVNAYVISCEVQTTVSNVDERNAEKSLKLFVFVYKHVSK